jgi:hypothetical protein
MNIYQNKAFLYICLAVATILMASCQKEGLEPNSVQEDYRNELIGIYTGKVQFQDILSVTDSKTTDKVHDDIVENQSVEIFKVENQVNGLLINANPINMVLQSVENKNNFSDIFIYATKDCSGTESYILEFNPSTGHLKLEYKHSRDCDAENLKQNYYFSGNK